MLMAVKATRAKEWKEAKESIKAKKKPPQSAEALCFVYRLCY
jgi:hypothetical protein